MGARIRQLAEPVGGASGRTFEHRHLPLINRGLDADKNAEYSRKKQKFFKKNGMSLPVKRGKMREWEEIND